MRLLVTDRNGQNPAHLYTMCTAMGRVLFQLGWLHTQKKVFQRDCYIQSEHKFPHSHPPPSPSPLHSTHVMSSVEKLMMVGMKFSRIRILRMDFHSVVGSPISRQILSMAIFTSRGGEGRDRTSTRCCFFIPLTAVHQNKETLDSM